MKVGVHFQEIDQDVSVNFSEFLNLYTLALSIWPVHQFLDDKIWSRYFAAGFLGDQEGPHEFQPPSPKSDLPKPWLVVLRYTFVASPMGEPK